MLFLFVDLRKTGTLYLLKLETNSYALPPLPIFNLVALNSGASITPWSVPCESDIAAVPVSNARLSWRIWYCEGKLGCDGLISFKWITQSILVLCSYPEAVFFVGLQSNYIIVATPHKAAHLHPQLGNK